MIRLIVTLGLMLSVVREFAVKLGWNEEFEFCENQWNEFVHEKKEWEQRCKNLSSTVGCIEEEEYLLDRFIMFSEICPLEGALYIYLPEILI